jgi:hypothetical protein
MSTTSLQSGFLVTPVTSAGTASGDYDRDHSIPTARSRQSSASTVWSFIADVFVEPLRRLKRAVVRVGCFVPVQSKFLLTAIHLIYSYSCDRTGSGILSIQIYMEIDMLRTWSAVQISSRRCFKQQEKSWRRKRRKRDISGGKLQSRGASRANRKGR